MKILAVWKKTFCVSGTPTDPYFTPTLKFLEDLGKIPVSENRFSTILYKILYKNTNAKIGLNLSHAKT